jgi:octaprenyl-diphosphate synthase
MRTGTPEQAQTIRTALEQADRTLLPQVLTAVTESGALDYARSVAQQEAEQALAHLNCLPESPFTEALRLLPRIAIERSN